MNLGSLVTIAEAAPANLYHFLFANGIYEVNGEHPLPGSGRTDFSAIARGAGYAGATRYADLERLSADLPGILEGTGPVFHELVVKKGRDYPRDYDTIHGAAVRERFKAALNASPSAA
jgi:phosphonopyruvate decarboxylase